MNDPASKPTDAPPTPRNRHETRDVRVRVIVLCALALTLALVASQPLLLWFFDYQAKRVRQNAPAISPLAEREVPPPPRLQSHPRTDFKQFREREDAWLNSYGWVDRQEQIVRMPIERAMELIAERGLPETPPATPPDEAERDSREPRGSRP